MSGRHFGTYAPQVKLSLENLIILTLDFTGELHRGEKEKEQGSFLTMFNADVCASLSLLFLHAS